jgi:hypothetical protein
LTRALKSEVITEHNVNDVHSMYYEPTIGCNIQVLLCESLDEKREDQNNLFFVELVDIGGNAMNYNERSRTILYEGCDAVIFVWYHYSNLFKITFAV